ncbi:MAG: hypothetical protein HQL63_12230 [Magnetococcales bacterium]|nr:hypothetical protein [Magnetococcales bacterium]MBF0322724.1 hypothetical protein [Magnetococcales bacterium]
MDPARGIVAGERWECALHPDTQAPCRRVAKLAEIPREAKPLIKHLIEQRLLATDLDQESSEVTIEPAHEALLRQWGLLQRWLEEDFAALTTLEGAQRSTRDRKANARDHTWRNHRRDKELAEARKLVEAQKREAEAQKKMTQRTRVGLAIATGLMIVAGVGAWFGFSGQRVAERECAVAVTACS